MARIDQAQDLLGNATTTGDVHLIAVIFAETAADRPIGLVSDDRRVITTVSGLGATITGALGNIVHAAEAGVHPNHAVFEAVDARGLPLTGELQARVTNRIDDGTE